MVVVYSTPACPYCTMAKNYLSDNNVKFKDLNVAQNPGWAREMIQKSGQQGVPVIDYNGQIIIGFDRKRLEKLIRG